MSVDNIPNGWIENTLGEVCQVKGGKRIPKGETLIQEKTNHPYIRITDFEGNSINKSNLLFVPNHTFEKISRYIVNENDIIISIVGTIGLVAKIDAILDNASLTENCNKLVNLKGIEGDFIYYYLTSRIGQYQISLNTVGAVQKKLPIYGVQNIKISYPKDIKEQKAIAKILTVFDDKIENLQVQNKTLETTAQTIFKEQFGKYQIGDVLPDGWHHTELGDIAFNYSKSFKFSDKNVVFINTGDVSKGQFLHSNEIPPIGLPGQAKKAIELHDILYSEIRPKNKRFAFVDFETPNYVVSTKFMIIRPIDDFSPFILYFILKSKEAIDEFNIAAESRSGTFPQITFDSIKHYPIILPPLEIQLNFEKTLKIIMEKQKNNAKQIQTLKKTRDTLLPKLISGQLRVNDYKE